MKNLNDSIKELFEIAFKNAGFENVDVAILPCNLANMGDFQCNNALSIAKVYGKSPRDIAQKVLENIPDNEIICDCNIAGPGFINIKVQEKYLQKYLINFFDTIDEKLDIDSDNIIID